MAEQEAAFCPNCNKPAVRQGKVILCEGCDASFRFTQEGPKLHDIGPIERRVAALEEKLGIGVTPPADPPGLQGDPVIDDDDDEAEENENDDDEGI